MRSIVLDMMRCLAIGLLLLAHIGQAVGSSVGGFFGVPGFYYVSLGGVAVTMFLVLSGAALELTYGDMKIKYGQFMVKRLLRLYPVYYLSLIVGVLVYICRSYDDMSGFRVWDAILSMTGMYAFAGRWGGPFVATSWFMALIMAMYVLFPFLSRQVKARPLWALVVLAFVSVVSRLMLGKGDILPMRAIDWFPLCRILEFAAGIYLAMLLSRMNMQGFRRSRIVSGALAFVSELSFPLFLVHYPLLFLIGYLTGHGVNRWLSVLVFLAVSSLVSWMILLVDRKVPRAALLERIALAGPGG